MSVAWVGVGVSALSTLSSMSASGEAADAQSGAADRASATQEAARLQQREDLKPWTSAGNAANNALMYKLGLGGSRPGSSYGSLPAGALTSDQFRARYDQPVNRDWNDQEITNLDTAYNRYMSGLTGGDPEFGSLTSKFGQADLEKDVVYQNGLQFGLNTGINQLNQRAAAGGNYGSGAALKALTRFGNDYATTKTEGAYNRNQGEKAQTYNFLSGVSSQGQSAAAGVGAAGIGTANNIANNQLASGNAQSAGIVGGANALSSGLAGATNALQWNQMMSKPRASTQLSNSWDIPMQAGGGY